MTWSDIHYCVRVDWFVTSVRFRNIEVVDWIYRTLIKHDNRLISRSINFCTTVCKILNDCYKSQIIEDKYGVQEFPDNYYIIVIQGFNAELDESEKVLVIDNYNIEAIDDNNRIFQMSPSDIKLLSTIIDEFRQLSNDYICYAKYKNKDGIVREIMQVGNIGEWEYI
jgi:hypothetical protein